MNDKVIREVEAVNEAGGLLVNRIERLIRLSDKYEEDKEHLQEALSMIQEYLEERMPRIIRKYKKDADIDLDVGILREDTME